MMDIKRIEEEFDNHPLLPSHLLQYIRKAIKAEAHDDTFMCSLRHNGIDVTLRNVSQMLQTASEYTGLPPDKLLRDLDFHPADMDIGRIDACFAEFRAINFLGASGFTDIKPIKSSNTREVDILAMLENRRFAIEVFHSARRKYRYPGHQEPRRDLSAFLVDRAKSKKAQIDSTIRSHNCGAGLLICVLDSQPANALMTQTRFSALLQNMAQELAWGNIYYFGIVTGQVTPDGTLDDVVYPDLEG